MFYLCKQHFGPISIDLYKTQKYRDIWGLKPNYVLIEFYINGGTWRYFRDTWSATLKYMLGVFFTPSIYLCSLFVLVEPNLADKIGNSLSPLLGHPIITLPARTTTTAAVAATTFG